MNVSKIIVDIVEQLKDVNGIEAVVLGGSRARGTYHETSDIDLGIYYFPLTPFSLKDLDRLTKEIDDEHRENLITGIDGWGPWINGGGWLTVEKIAVDFIFRDIDKVNRIIKECHDGHIDMVYQPGHPHGFASYIYLSEIALCQALWDPNGTIGNLKQKVQPYPIQLKRAILEKFWWEADFSLKLAKKGLGHRDVIYINGCCFRCISCLIQTIFAMNEQYWMNEKGSVTLAAGFKITLPRLIERANRIFNQISDSSRVTNRSLDILQGLVEDCDVLVKTMT